ncbi:MAG: hypothetical protein HYW86_01205 [Candidatus Roizmanbacteria bacterium]|nr:MAG: hypothetical protein HYW86_01205 [Candidatus Roizmanbacteria bacterium]
MNYKIKIIVVVFLIVTIFLIIVTTLLQKQNVKKSNSYDSKSVIPTDFIPSKLSPTPLSFDAPFVNQDYKKSAQEINKAESPIVEKEAAVGRLLNLLPYSGKNFKMINDYNKAQYVVTIPKSKEKEGNEEFDAFLKKNGIQDRLWIRKNLLVINYE